jgi:hypothetical protein
MNKQKVKTTLEKKRPRVKRVETRARKKLKSPPPPPPPTPKKTGEVRSKSTAGNKAMRTAKPKNKL